MRLTRLDLLAFGHFSGLALDFEAPGLHVVFGRNEAGKSTTLRAITGLLYGIDARTPDAHLHKMSELRVGGVLEAPGGARLRVVRRKGNAHTLQDADGNVLPDDALRPFLRAISEDTFRHAFGLDHDGLRRGAEGLLSGKGDLGESLFDASAGAGGDVQRLLARLEQAADGLYRPRASALPLNQALKAYEAAQKRVLERQSLPSAYLKQEEHVEQLRVSQAERLARRDALRRAKEGLARAKTRRPLDQRHAELVAARDALGRVAHHGGRLAGLDGRLGAYESDLRSLAKLNAERAIAAGRVHEAARAAAKPAQRLDPKTTARLTKLVHERDALATKIEEGGAALAGFEAELARLRPLLDGAASDPGGLEDALSRARDLGDMEERIASALSRHARRQTDVQARLAQLGVRAQPASALATVVVPDEHVLAALDVRGSEAKGLMARLEARVQDLDAGLLLLERQIAEATGDFAPPDAAELARARRERDDALALARGSGGQEAARVHEATFDRLAREADAVADRMIREADRVTSLARQKSTQAVQVAQRAAARAELETARAAHGGVQGELAGLFAATPYVPPTTVEAARALLARHAQLVALVSEAAEGDAEISSMQRTLERACAELARALGLPEPSAASLDLRGLVLLGSNRLREAEAAARTRDDAVRALEATEQQRDTLSAELSRAALRRSEVLTQLRTLGEGLGLDDDATPDEALGAVEGVRALEAAEDAEREVAHRVEGVRVLTEAFERDVATLAADLAPDLGALPARDAAASLVERLGRARAIEADLGAVSARLDELGPRTAEEEAIELSGAELERALDAASVDLDAVEREAAGVERDIGGAMAGLRAMRGESHAAEAAAEAHDALARVRGQVERYCRARIAHTILAREIERYRDENQAPLLARASSLFAQLTLGAFTSVRGGLDDKDRACLTCVRAGGATTPVEGLSEGTRDQLYLALRLASLERHAEAGGPMPLVLDDVLIQLDDDRARAALTVLAETSARMQVLFFTHHARLVELARAAVPPSQLVVHDLGARDVMQPKPGGIADRTGALPSG